MTNYACHRQYLHWLGVHQLDKASCGVSAKSLKYFLSKIEKVQKSINHV